MWIENNVRWQSAFAIDFYLALYRNLDYYTAITSNEMIFYVTFKFYWRLTA